MKIEDKVLIKSTAKMVALLLGIFFAIKITSGVAVGGVVAVAVWAGISGRRGIALACYVLIPLLIMINPYICNMGGIGASIARLGFVGMTFFLMFSANKQQGHEMVPLAPLLLYGVVACISSIGGYCPVISYMKLLNFFSFILGIWLGLRNLHRDGKSLWFLRRFLLAFAAFIILGSAFLVVFAPGIAYFHSYERVIGEAGIAVANSVGKMDQNSAGRLLCGVVSQSQCLSTLLVVTQAWVLCDMLFVERRRSRLHLVMLLVSIPLLYWTRSRTGLLSAVVAVAMIYTYCFAHLQVSHRLKIALRSAMTGLIVVVALAAMVLEIRDQSITKWVRKVDDVKGDQRSVSEAFTQSRMGLVHASMEDFHRNPLFGTGFQVMYDFQFIDTSGRLILSAPIEKGVLPVMILGETGVAGAIAFAFFLVCFYGVCSRKHYAVTATLFTVLIASNMGEATFFSTGGAGGITWVMSIVGGFCIDMVVLARRREELAAPVYFR